MQTITLYVGLDVHKDSITIAIAEPGSKGEVRLFGTISNSIQALERTLSPPRSTLRRVISGPYLTADINQAVAYPRGNWLELCELSVPACGITSPVEAKA
jgi:hypothetical protein